jgi:N utilization substance protein B
VSKPAGKVEPTRSDGPPPSARTRARRAALQALYQWQLTGQSAAEIEDQFVGERLAEVGGRLDRPYFRWLLHEVSARAGELDGRFAEWLDRPLEQLDPVERSILRIGTLELAERPEIPTAVVIDEAIALAKMFGAEQGHRYVNGVLDRVARAARRANVRA